MGYYVRIAESTAKIAKKNLKKAYKLMCALNEDDSKKRGGSYSNGRKTKSWFSWMDEDYPNKCKTAAEILDELGFDSYVTEDGDLMIESYDHKSGQEALFFEAIAHLVEGEIEWRGEDGELWKWIFGKNGMETKVGKVIYE